MYIKLDAYLAQLKANERARPKNERRHVPNLSALAEATGVSRAHMANIARNKVKSLNLDLADKIITEMRRRKFDMELTDLLEYQETVQC